MEVFWPWIADVLSAYDTVIQKIPIGYFNSPTANLAIAGLQTASAAVPRLTANSPLPKDLDRSSVKEFIHESYRPVLRCLEDVLEVLEDLAMDTRSNEPSPRKSCNALHKIYQLKRATPRLTAILAYLTDKKKQDAIIWGAFAVSGVVLVGGAVAAVCLLPVAAPVAGAGALASTSAATGAAGATGAAAATGTVAVTRAVAASGAVIIAAEAGGAAAAVTTTSAVAASSGTISASAMAASAVGGATFGHSGVMTIFALLELADSRNIQFINTGINRILEETLYYVALCFMRSNGIANPCDADDLEGTLKKLYGRRPKNSQQVYRAVVFA
ncbi:uncharacterized protein LY89DRAFT_275552 [Mollisia scopiformis]|uniref:Uncharacterized protein n=1 Tax=Mollisia scopiformis TaxID=149040 RepID=A0A132BBC3_MOLSC|nr:uncharacterized protein LY89DRAFT_275552 [Mollisia scopiformis]KUJ09678.1 hypothetical protein LY89DRAFT_275552 [Mollisia scopiformis]